MRPKPLKFNITEMISRLPLSCLRPIVLKQSVRSVKITTAVTARGRGSNISQAWLNKKSLKNFLEKFQSLSQVRKK